VYGQGTYGVYGTGSSYGVYGSSAGNAGYFQGNVTVTGNVTVGTGTIFLDGTNSRVGIGDSAPQNALSVMGNEANKSIVNISNQLDKPIAITFDGIRDWQIGQNRPFDLLPFDVFYINDVTAGATRLLIDTGGRVGIGTTTPQNKLDVEGGAVVGATYSGTNTAPSNGLLVQGNVGIGTTSTAARLSVGDAGTDPNAGIYSYGSTHGVIGTVQTGHGAAASGVGVYGAYNGNNYGYLGGNGYGVYGAGTNWAGYFSSGNVYVQNNVSIGTTGAAYALDVLENTDSGYAARFWNDGNAANRYGIRINAGEDTPAGTTYLVDFGDGNGDLIGWIVSNAGVISYTAFTGSHIASVPEEFEASGYLYGTVMCLKSATTVVEIPGQPEYYVEPCSEEYDKSVFGVYSHKDREENSHSIYAIGDGHVLVTDGGGNVEIGDYLTSSNVAGYAMKQDDDLLHSYTLAKATESVDWNTVPMDPEKGFKWKLVSCTYHAA